MLPEILCRSAYLTTARVHREDVAVQRAIPIGSHIRPVGVIVSATQVGEDGVIPFPYQIHFVVFALQAGKVGELQILHGDECTYKN